MRRWEQRSRKSSAIAFSASEQALFKIMRQVRMNCKQQAAAGKPQRSEAFRDLLFVVPGIYAGEVYLFPTERREMHEQVVGNIPALLP